MIDIKKRLNKLGIFYGKMATTYSLQIRTVQLDYCYLKGGKWKSYLQLDRFSIRKIKYDG